VPKDGTAQQPQKMLTRHEGDSMRLAGLVISISLKLLPEKVVRHYVKPLFVLQEKAPYNMEKYFRSWHRATLDQEFSDRNTISPNHNPLFSRYHYNAVENSIIEYFASQHIIKPLKVLDIGSGAGHWIDFYCDVFQAAHVVGVEISRPCVTALCKKYEHADNIHIIQADVSCSDFSLGEKFDIINAIGVIFHIVDDDLWRQTVKNLSAHLEKDGVIVVGGQFGLITQNVQFHTTDEFSTWEEYRTAHSDVTLVNKRIRSLRRWRDCARIAGLRVFCVKRTKQHKEILTPENNVLFLSHER
jgi:2-polyprenyl-3-methyl-5-hydroxy-6-metoxy-1,4-benzoquinol methylase